MLTPSVIENFESILERTNDVAVLYAARGDAARAKADLQVLADAGVPLDAVAIEDYKLRPGWKDQPYGINDAAQMRKWA